MDLPFEPSIAGAAGLDEGNSLASCTALVASSFSRGFIAPTTRTAFAAAEKVVPTCSLPDLPRTTFSMVVAASLDIASMFFADFVRAMAAMTVAAPWRCSLYSSISLMVSGRCSRPE